jgi:uncharacterized membrane protein required for colicin V production
VILCILAGGALVGALVGFLWQMFWLSSVAAGLYCSIAFHGPATMLVERHLMQGAGAGAAEGAAYLLVFVIVFVLFLILTLALHRMVRQARLQWLNRLLGSAFVAVILAAVMGVALVLLAAVPGSRDVVEQSKIAPILVASLQSVMARLPDEWRQSAEEKIGHPMPVPVPLPSAPPIRPSGPTAGKPPSLQVRPLADQIIEELSKSKK